MEVLPKDIVLIVYRYIYQYNYDVMREQYKHLWLNDPSIAANIGDFNMSLIFWDDNLHCFCTDHTFVANYRTRDWWFENIYYFTMYYKTLEQYNNIDSAETGAKLPQNYEHAQSFLKQINHSL